MSLKVMHTPRSVDLELTSRCNLKCSYCYYLNNQEVQYRDIPTESWLSFIRELGDAQVLSVCLSGGEPLLRDDIFSLIDAIVDNRMRFSLLSNGLAVNADVARRLRQTGRCNYVQISLDGSRPEIHEIMRGKGSFVPALNAIRCLQDADVPVTVRVTVHAKNIDDLPAISHLLLDKFELPEYSINGISSLGSHAKYDASIFMSAAERLRAMQILAKLDRRYPGRIEASAGPLAEWKMFHEMRNAQLSGGAIPGKGRLIGCGCIFTRIAVRADGAYIPCVMLPQIVLGFIGENRLHDVWQVSEDLNQLRQRTRISLDNFDDCRNCNYRNACTGNCAGVAFSLLGDANQPSPDACFKRFERELADEGLVFS